MNIHEAIYQTLNLTVAESSVSTSLNDENSVIVRREQLQTFLKHNRWDLEDYKTWLRSGQWTPKDKARGAGDLIAKATSYVGLKSCGGCKGRQKTLNKMFPNKRMRHG
jgi:hypothetical protein